MGTWYEFTNDVSERSPTQHACYLRLVGQTTTTLENRYGRDQHLLTTFPMRTGRCDVQTPFVHYIANRFLSELPGYAVSYWTESDKLYIYWNLSYLHPAAMLLLFRVLRATTEELSVVMGVNELLSSDTGKEYAEQLSLLELCWVGRLLSFLKYRAGTLVLPEGALTYVVPRETFGCNFSYFTTGGHQFPCLTWALSTETRDSFAYCIAKTMQPDFLKFLDLPRNKQFKSDMGFREGYKYVDVTSLTLANYTPKDTWTLDHIIAARAALSELKIKRGSAYEDQGN